MGQPAPGRRAAPPSCAFRLARSTSEPPPAIRWGLATTPPSSSRAARSTRPDASASVSQRTTSPTRRRAASSRSARSATRRATQASFDLGQGLGPDVVMSGGTVIIRINCTGVPASVTTAISRATRRSSITNTVLQFGDAGSGVAKTFNAEGLLPNVVVSNASAGHTVLFRPPTHLQQQRARRDDQPGLHVQHRQPGLPGERQHRHEQRNADGEQRRRPGSSGSRRAATAPTRAPASARAC